MAKSPNVSHWINVSNTRSSVREFCSEEMRLQADVEADSNGGSYVAPPSPR